VTKRLSVEADVVCRGRVPHNQVAAFYQHAALMVMPSLHETFGLPVLEAMALGCPVVTSNLSSMPEIGGDAVELVDPYSVDSIAEGMRRVLRDADLRQEMIERGRRRAADFTREMMVARLLSVIEQVGQ